MRRGLRFIVVLCVGKEPQTFHVRNICYMSQQQGEQVGGYKYPKLQEDAALVALLKTCTKKKDLYKGSRIHAAIVNRGILKTNVFIGSTLINMYAKCGALEKAREVFDELPIRNVVSWNALIAGYAQHGHGEDALVCCDRMQQDGLSPDEVTFACILKACGSIGAVEQGNKIHVQIVGMGFLSKNIVLGNALVDMYAKCGALAKAQKVFDDLPTRNVVSWTTLIAGYCQHGHGEKALDCFEQMLDEGLLPDAVTLRCILKACGSIGATEKGKEIHAEMAREGFLGRDSVLGNALVDMYAKCGALAKAQEVFDELLVPDIVSWTALIAGYAQYGQGDEALNRLEKMQGEGLVPNSVTLLSILKACCSIGAAEKGEAIHAEVVREGLLGKDCVLGNTLLDMYAKCGALAKAHQVFDELSTRSVVSWTSLIAGYAQIGKHDIVFDLFNRMIGQGIDPNLVTFLVVLNSCSFLGLVNEGQMYFEIMSTSYGIIPTLKHDTCMVDLFGRAGHFDMAMAVINRMPSPEQHLSVWFALLTACQKWGNEKLGRLAFNHALRLDRKSVMAYVCRTDTHTRSI